MEKQKDDISAQAVLRTNEFSLKMTGLIDMEFDIEDYCITGGQPWEGLTGIQCTREGCTFAVKAGRKGSKEVATWFKEKIGNGSAIGCSTYDRLPEKLNFAFVGTMSFIHRKKNYVGKEIVIGQGHSTRSRNNWWIGGPHMSEMVNIPAGHLAASKQNFYVGILPSFVIFSTFFNVSSMNMGIVGL